MRSIPSLRLVPAALLLAVAVTACAGTRTPAPFPETTSTVVDTAPVGLDSDIDVRLTIGDEVVPATIDDTAAGRAFVSMLPLTLEFRDRFGQATVADLPRALTATTGGVQYEYRAGDIAYWPGGREIAIFYPADPGVATPGLIPLGIVTDDLGVLAGANTIIADLDRD